MYNNSSLYNCSNRELIDDLAIRRYAKIVALFTWAYCIPGSCVPFLVLLANVKSLKMESKPFTILVLNTMLADFTLVLLFIFYAAPCDYLFIDIFGKTGGMMAGSYQAFAFCTSLFTSFIISVNRFVAIFFPHHLEALFSVKKTACVATATWFLAAAWTLLDVFSTSCYYVYDFEKFIFNLLCPDASGDHFFVASVSVIGLYGIGGLYLIALIKLKYDNSKISSETIAQTMAKRRMKVFWQAFGIWASILINVLSYHFISPYMTDLLTNGIVSVVMILCPPYGSCVIVLIFDSRILRIFRSFFGQVSNEVRNKTEVAGCYLYFLAGHSHPNKYVEQTCMVKGCK